MVQKKIGRQGQRSPQDDPNYSLTLDNVVLSQVSGWGFFFGSTLFSNLGENSDHKLETRGEKAGMTHKGVCREKIVDSCAEQSQLNKENPNENVGRKFLPR